jgi:long-chain acyl-CoA synthetase
MTRQLLIADGIRHWALLTPGKTALTVGSRSLSFAELSERVDRVANGAAHGLGLEPGDRIAFLSPNCLEYVEVLIGLAAGGTPCVSISPTASAPELAAICEDSEARVLIVHPSLEEHARAAGLDGIERTIVIGPDYDAWLADSRPHAPAVDPRHTEIAWLQYTSGTTGKPKGAAIDHHSKPFHYISKCQEYGFDQTDHHLVIGPLAHGGSSGKALGFSFIGAEVTVAPIFHPERILRIIESRRITTVATVPGQLKALLGLGPETLARYDLSSLRTISVGSAPCSQALKLEAIATFGEGMLYEDYGSTELSLISVTQPADHVRKPQSSGQPILGTILKVVDDDGQPVAPGEIGELYGKTTSMFLRYWNRPEETAAALEDGFFKTGDMGKIDEDGFLYLLDRMNDKIITGGFTVFAREIEEKLAQHPAVAEVVAFGVPDEQLGEAIRAAVTLSDGLSLAPDELQAYCASELTSYKRPKWIDVQDALPRNATGKIQRRALRDPFWEGRERRIS